MDKLSRLVRALQVLHTCAPEETETFIEVFGESYPRIKSRLQRLQSRIGDNQVYNAIDLVGHVPAHPASPRYHRIIVRSKYERENTDHTDGGDCKRFSEVIY